MRRLYFAPSLILLVLIQFGLDSAVAKDKWTSVRSNNFFLVGNASEEDIREVAIRLEQFRDGFARLFTGFRFSSATATTVVVFKSNAAFDPYKPVYQGKPGNVAGYFQSGQDVNYITLTTERLSDDPFHIIFHEYVHLLLHNTVKDLPPWFDEGLAEYYSTFDAADDGRKFWVGRVLPQHLQTAENRTVDAAADTARRRSQIALLQRARQERNLLRAILGTGPLLDPRK